LATSLLELIELVGEQGGGDRRPARLAAQPGLGEPLGLLIGDLARHRRLVGVDQHVDQGRARVVQGRAQRRLDLVGLLDPDAEPAAGGGEGAKFIGWEKRTPNSG
jgi:hypothetical protein